MKVKKKLTAAHELHRLFVAFYDESALQPPILIGDPLHAAICKYRDSLPDRHLPPGEGKLMRELLDLSRSKAINDRRNAQSMSENWAKLLREKYPPLRADDPYPPGLATCGLSDSQQVASDYSEPDGPSQWAKKFNMSPKTFIRRVKEGKIRAVKFSTKSYRILKSDLPK